MAESKWENAKLAPLALIVGLFAGPYLELSGVAGGKRDGFSAGASGHRRATGLNL